MGIDLNICFAYLLVQPFSDATHSNIFNFIFICDEANGTISFPSMSEPGSNSLSTVRLSNNLALAL